MISYRGEDFDGYNKPKRTPKHPTKSHAVLAKEGDKVKLIRFGQQGVSGSPANLANRKLPKQDVPASRLVMLRTLRRAKCLLLIGLTRRSGNFLLLYPVFKLSHIPTQILRFGSVPTVAGISVSLHMPVNGFEALIDKRVPRFTHNRAPLPF